MDIRTLRYYLAVCREGSMSHAAAALHVTQPTLSRQIADLERELGCSLLERGSRGVAPTEKGLYLRRRAEEIIAIADQTAADLSYQDAAVEGDVYVGSGESEGMRVVASCVHAFRERHPHVRFHVRSGNGDDVTDWLDRGLVDFGLLVSYPDVGRFDHVRLSPTDAWGVLMPEKDPLTKKEAVAPADLAGLPLVASKQALDSGELARWFGNHGADLQVAATYNLVFNGAMLVREHVGYALALEGLTPTGPGTGLEFRLLYPPLVSAVDFAWKHGQPLSTAAKLFLEDMKEAAAPMTSTDATA